MKERTAYIFPAFALKYTGKEITIVEKYKYDFYNRLTIASDVLGQNLNNFNIKTNNYLDNEFLNQIYSYIFSCTFSDILQQKKEAPLFVSGFSMGLYAALYHSKSISFKTGLNLLSDVYSLINSSLKSEAYTMVSVIGFDRNDLQNFISNYQSVNIVIQNGYFSFVLSGTQNDFNILLETLKKEGAVHINKFKISSPYHSPILQTKQANFNNIITKYEYNTPDIPLISMIDQRQITSVIEVKNELVKNISEPLNFLKTIEYFVNNKISSFIEVGADASLRKSSKFIKEEFTIQSVAKGKVL